MPRIAGLGNGEINQ